MDRSRRDIGKLATGLLLGGLATPHVANAQAGFPSRPIRIICPAAAGGGTDTVARLLAPKLTAALGQPVVVENRTGGAEMIGGHAAATSPPDGHTLFISALGIAINWSLFRKPFFNAAEDFEPVAHLLSIPFVVIVNPRFEARTLPELAEATRRGEGLHFAEAGSSTRVAGEMFRLVAGGRVTFVAYRGSGPSTLAVVSGEVPAFVSDLPSAAGQITGGGVRALAVTGPSRSPLIPDVPTTTEAGMPEFSPTTWYGMFAPKGTPEPTVARLNEELNKAMLSPDVKARLGTMGAEPVTRSHAEFARFYRDELHRWRDVVMRAGIQRDEG
jgi:tripartite-type tricarboxylate transporter receptor subunit TctC